MTDYQALFNDDSFKKISALIHTCRSADWRDKHPTSKILFNYDSLYKAVVSSNTRDIAIHYSKLVTDVVEHDINLMVYHTTATMDWLIQTLDKQDCTTILMLMLAIASCEFEYLTPVEASSLSGGSESYWRNSASDIPGAIKKGKQWLIPSSWVHANMEVNGYAK